MQWITWCLQNKYGVANQQYFKNCHDNNISCDVINTTVIYAANCYLVVYEVSTHYVKCNLSYGFIFINPMSIFPSTQGQFFPTTPTQLLYNPVPNISFDCTKHSRLIYCIIISMNISNNVLYIKIIKNINFLYNIFAFRFIFVQ